ncbi:cell division protein FtsZ [Candidatus Bipolaricaulota bacterium]|nr:cell division protein FtsZ [Candidatus Bipolaricaulota bacterium]
MTDNARLESTEKGIRETWRAILSAVDDRILRACLPADFRSITLSDDQLIISVESEFKKEYCQRKIDSLRSAVGHVVGPREIVIGEPPLLEQAREQHQHVQHGPSARILVMGVGDGGVNAVDRMRAEQLEGVRLIAVDTDHQVLQACHVTETLQLGLDVTAGRGTGGDVIKGRKAAVESRWEIASLVRDMDLVFITAGFGGGTGSGAAPVIAEIAKENGALTVGVVTRPFAFEGTVRQKRAELGLEEFRKAADVLIVISNDRLLETSARGLPMTKAFELADGILHQGVRGISDLITVRGLINLDFADIRSLLANAGDAMMGMGQAVGDKRAMTAAKLASTNPLLDGESIRGARKMIMNVTGGDDLTLGEVITAADHIRKAAATECDLVFGAVVREQFQEGVRITVIAADFQAADLVGKERRQSASRERIRTDGNLDMPTFLRREKTERSEKQGNTGKSA